MAACVLNVEIHIHAKSFVFPACMLASAEPAGPPPTALPPLQRRVSPDPSGVNVPAWNSW